MIGAVVATAIGIWLMLAPYVLHYGGVTADHHYIVGPLIVSFGLSAIWEVCREMRWWNFALGLWLLVSLLVWEHSATVGWSVGLSGVGCMLASLHRGQKKDKLGGTWFDLFRDGIPPEQTAAERRLVSSERQ